MFFKELVLYYIILFKSHELREDKRRNFNFIN